MLNKKNALSAAFVFLILCASAQVRFSANPIAISRNADALLSITATSSYSKPAEGELVITVTEEGTGRPVLTVNFSRVLLSPGNNGLSRFRSFASRIFYDNELSSIVKNTGLFAPATYLICCQFNPEDKLLPVFDNETCFISDVMPRTPIILIQPVDSICNYRPAFNWSGRKTASQATAFKVVCVEVQEGQSAEEALQNNFPQVNQALYTQVSQLAFPPGSPALKEGRKYAWQVLEVAGINVLNSSDIGEFTVACKEAPADPGVESFAEAKSFYTGKTYYFTSSINFSFVNPYVDGRLEYDIVHVPSLKKLSNLPVIEMKQGLNRIVLNTEDIGGLKKGEAYKIRIYNLGNVVHYINFIIKDTE